MSRKPRIISESGMYHVIFRGNNKQNIFNDEQDYKKIKGIIKDIKEQMSFEIYAYCLMTNHVHMLMREKEPGDISLIIKKVLTRYAMWFNKKYQRSGGLFENRYKAMAVDDETYLYEVLRYIHSNPVAAGISAQIDEYPYSSYKEYFEQYPYILDKGFFMSMMSKSEFVDFHSREEIVVSRLEKVSDDELRNIIISKYGVAPKNIGLLNKEQIAEIIRELEKFCSKRQIEKVTGITRWKMSKL